MQVKQIRAGTEQGFQGTRIRAMQKQQHDKLEPMLVKARGQNRSQSKKGSDRATSVQNSAMAR